MGHRSLIGGAWIDTTHPCNEGRRVSSVLPAGVDLHQLETGVQAMQLSPYRAGLAEPALQRFQTVAALPTCCFPPWLSPQGRSVDPRTPSESFPSESGILCRVTRRTVTVKGLLCHRVDADVGARQRASDGDPHRGAVTEGGPYLPRLGVDRLDLPQGHVSN